MDFGGVVEVEGSGVDVVDVVDVVDDVEGVAVVVGSSEEPAGGLSSVVELHRMELSVVVGFASPRGRPWSKENIRRRGIERTWMRF